MSTQWRKVTNKCIECNQPVGKFSLKAGKISVDKLFDCWGSWQKVKGKSEMQVICRICQKMLAKQKRKKERLEARLR